LSGRVASRAESAAPERLSHHKLDDVEEIEDLLLDLILAQEDVRVVHRQPAHPQHAVQRP